MDPSIGALISAMAEASQQSRRDHELAMAQLLQGQNAFMERLGQTLTQQGTSARAAHSSLVDPHGVGKPPSLTGRMANDPVSFRAWRIKFRNWVVAAIPEAAEVMQRLESQNQEEITEDVFATWVQTAPIATRLSAQLSASLIAMTEDEPFQIIDKGPQG